MSQISVIIPIYHAEKTLTRCLRSIQEQTFSDFEVLMINDCSTDDSVGICEEFSKADSRFRLIHQPYNQGPSAARNRGIEEARAKYLSFVDADDYIEPDLLEKFYDTAEESNADMVVCSYLEEYPDRTIKKRASSYEAGLYCGDACREIAINAIDNAGVLNVYSWIRFVRRECLEKTAYRFSTEIYRSEDFLLWTKFNFQINRLYLLTDDHLYHYVMNEGSITHRYVAGYWQMVKQIHQHLTSALPKEERVIKKINHAVLQRAFTAINAAVYAETETVFSKAFFEIVRDKLLKEIVKDMKMQDVPKAFRRHLGLLKLRLYRVLRVVYLRKFRRVFSASRNFKTFS